MFYIGIDPGVSGGLALLDSRGGVAAVSKMPGTERDLLDLLEAWDDAGRGSGSNGGEHGKRIRAGAIERVWSSPQMGVVSAFTFGRGFGALRMALTSIRVPFDEVLPHRWQTALGCLSRGDKNVTKRRAQQLFPSQTVTHAVADALLIAEFCRRQHEGVNRGKVKKVGQTKTGKARS